MAAKKKSVKKGGRKLQESDLEDLSQAQEPETDEPETDEPDEAAIRRVLADLGADGIDINITVYRVDPKTRKNEYIAACTPDEFSLEGLRDDWGGGEYRIYGRNANGAFLINRTVRIAPPIKKPALNDMGQFDLMSVVTRLGEMQTQQMNDFKSTMLELMLKNNQPVAGDPVTMMTAMMGAMVQMKKLTGEAASQSDNFETLMKGIELGKDLGGSDGDTGMFDVFKEFIKQTGGPLAKLAAAEKISKLRQPARNQAPAIAPAASAKTPAATGPLVDDPPKGEPEKMNFIFKKVMQKQINGLLSRAAANSDPGLYAEMILDQLPDDYVDKFADFIFSDDVMEEMTKLVPDVNKHLGWFIDLRDELREALQPDPDEVTGESLTDAPAGDKEKQTGEGQSSDASKNEIN